MIDLNPCPWCKIQPEPARRYIPGDYWFIACVRTRHEPLEFRRNSKAEVEAAWNDSAPAAQEPKPWCGCVDFYTPTKCKCLCHKHGYDGPCTVNKAWTAAQEPKPEMSAEVREALAVGEATDDKWIGGEWLAQNARRLLKAIAAEVRSLSEALAEAKRERDGWKESAAQFCRNADFYRGIVSGIGAQFGEVAYISDDGSHQQDVLCLKVPEMVAEARAKLEAMQADLAKCQEAILNPTCDHCETTHKRVNPSCCQQAEAQLAQARAEGARKDLALTVYAREAGRIAQSLSLMKELASHTQESKPAGGPRPCCEYGHGVIRCDDHAAPPPPGSGRAQGG